MLFAGRCSGKALYRNPAKDLSLRAFSIPLYSRPKVSLLICQDWQVLIVMPVKLIKAFLLACVVVLVLCAFAYLVEDFRHASIFTAAGALAGLLNILFWYLVARLLLRENSSKAVAWLAILVKLSLALTVVMILAEKGKEGSLPALAGFVAVYQIGLFLLLIENKE